MFKRFQTVITVSNRGERRYAQTLIRRAATLPLALVAALLLSAPTLAGGWAAIALDSPPQAPVAGEPQRIGFTVLQHGHNPVSEIGGQRLTPYLTATNPNTGETIRVGAQQQGAVGHFVVEVRFPSAGTWEWEITPDPFPLVTDAAAVGGNGHAHGEHGEGVQATPDWKPVTEFAALTVSPAEANMFGLKLGDAARTGSLAALALIAVAAAALAMRRRGADRSAKPTAANASQPGHK